MADLHARDADPLRDIAQEIVARTEWNYKEYERVYEETMDPKNDDLEEWRYKRARAALQSPSPVANLVKAGEAMKEAFYTGNDNEEAIACMEWDDIVGRVVWK